MEIKKNIYLFDWIKARGITQEQFSNETGISNSVVSGIINGGKRYNEDHLKKAAAYFNCEPWQLLYGPPDALPADDRDLDFIAGACAVIAQTVAEDYNRDGSINRLISANINEDMIRDRYWQHTAKTFMRLVSSQRDLKLSINQIAKVHRN